MKSVLASTPSGEEIAMESYNQDDLVYSKEPEEENFTTEIPELGKYSFEIVFDNDDVTESNSLSEKTVLPPNILSIEHNKEIDEVKLTWEDVEDAEAYLLKVFSGDEQIYSSQPLLSDTALTTYEANIPLEDFEQYLPGELEFEVASILYESTSNTSYLQALSGSSEVLSID
jgi:hypothetical protein